MEIIAGVVELKPNSMDKVDQWTATINDRIDEAIATLQDEGVQLESWFHLSLDGKDYLLSYMRAKSLQNAKDAVSRSNYTIDAYHQAFKQETWLKGTRAKLLVDLVNDTAFEGATKD